MGVPRGVSPNEAFPSHVTYGVRHCGETKDLVVNICTGCSAPKQHSLIEQPSVMQTPLGTGASSSTHSISHPRALYCVETAPPSLVFSVNENVRVAGLQRSGPRGRAWIATALTGRVDEQSRRQTISTRSLLAPAAQ